MAPIRAGAQAAEITMKSKDTRMERLRKLFGIKYLHELFPKGCTPNGAEYRHQECSGDVLRDMCQVGQNLANRRKTPKQAKDYARRYFTAGRVVTHQDVKDLLGKLRKNQVEAMVRETLKFQMEVEEAKAAGLPTPSPPYMAKADATVSDGATDNGINEFQEAIDEAVHETKNRRKRKRSAHRRDSSSPFYVDKLTARTKLHPTRPTRRAAPKKDVPKINAQTGDGADIYTDGYFDNQENGMISSHTNGHFSSNHFPPYQDVIALTEQINRLAEQNRRLTFTLRSVNDFNEQMKELFETGETGQEGVDAAETSILLINQGLESYGYQDDMERED